MDRCVCVLRQEKFDFNKSSEKILEDSEIFRHPVHFGRGMERLPTEKHLPNPLFHLPPSICSPSCPDSPKVSLALPLLAITDSTLIPLPSMLHPAARRGRVHTQRDLHRSRRVQVVRRRSGGRPIRHRLHLRHLRVQPADPSGWVIR